MSGKTNTFKPIPKNEGDGPSWLAIIVTLVFQMYPIAAILAFLRIRKSLKNKKLEKYRQYRRTIGSNETLSIKKLANILGQPRSDVRTTLSQMISKGYLGQEAYIDYSTDTLYITRAAASSAENFAPESHIDFDLSDISSGISDIISGITGIASDVADTLKKEFGARQSPSGHRYAPSGSGKSDSEAEPAAEKATGAPSEEKETGSNADKAKNSDADNCEKADATITDMTESEAALARLRQLNDDILDEEVSRRIDRIAMLTGDIYAFVSLNPDRAGEVRKFMNYYLPTTMKLLSSYSMLERQSYQGDNIVNARRDIEKILDTLVHAFENQLDRLFATDAVDISCDIQVLETMMAKDGLSSDKNGYTLQI